MEKETAKFLINGRVYELEVEPHLTLVELLREKVGFTGTKLSCGVGECGACTVLIDGNPKLSCCTLAITVKDKSIVTIEGLAKSGNLHPIQRAFVECGAIQCGFCTPGMILTAKAFLDENREPSKEDIKQALAGNLCRCTGYVKIVDAVLLAAKLMKGKQDSDQ